MCECFARCEADCVCDHDWTPPELTAARERIASLEAERDQLRAELAECRRDALRYRFLRDTDAGADIKRFVMRAGWDEIIDAALAAKEE